MDFDDILPLIGSFGRYQQLELFLVLLPCFIPCAFHTYNQIFMVIIPDHWCKVSQLSRFEFEVQKWLSIPLDSSTGQYSRCTMYDADYNQMLREASKSQNNSYSSGNWLLELWEVNVTNQWPVVSCLQDQWTYNVPNNTQNVISQWNIVCSKSWYPSLTLCLFALSGLVGNYLFGYLQDSIGRRLSFFVFLLIQTAFGLATAFAPNFLVWLVFRVGVGFTVPAIMGTPFVLSVELVGSAHRTMCILLTNAAYSIGLCLLAIVAYFVRDWSYLALATSLPFIPFFFYWWAMPESPRWLLAHGKYGAAEKVMKSMAAVNGKKLPMDYMADLKFLHEKEMAECEDYLTSCEVSDLFRQSNMRFKTVLITFFWFTTVTVYVGLMYYSPLIGYNPYCTFFLAAAVELPAYLLLSFLLGFWSRRWSIATYMAIAGVSCLSIYFSQEDALTTLCLFCAAKFAISSVFVILPLAAAELYPTVGRATGLSFSANVGMLGSVVVPIINYMGRQFFVLPLLVFGAMCCVCLFGVLLLPETLNARLPDTIEEGEMFGKRTMCCRSLRCCPPKNSASSDIFSHSKPNSPLLSGHGERGCVSNSQSEQATPRHRDGHSSAEPSPFESRRGHETTSDNEEDSTISVTVL